MQRSNTCKAYHTCCAWLESMCARYYCTSSNPALCREQLWQQAHELKIGVRGGSLVRHHSRHALWPRRRGIVSAQPLAIAVTPCVLHVPAVPAVTAPHVLKHFLQSAGLRFIMC